MVERRVVFPVIGDDEALQKDTRVIFTNQQLLTRNPSLQDELQLKIISQKLMPRDLRVSNLIKLKQALAHSIVR